MDFVKRSAPEHGQDGSVGFPDALAQVISADKREEHTPLLDPSFHAANVIQIGRISICHRSLRKQVVLAPLHGLPGISSGFGGWADFPRCLSSCDIEFLDELRRNYSKEELNVPWCTPRFSLLQTKFIHTLFREHYETSLDIGEEEKEHVGTDLE